MKKVFSMLALLLLTAVGATAQAQETVMTYPKAEWLKAGDILMHTPGQELFCGVIHPSAGLFEHYFDVDKAADEHRNYIMMLQKNGIRVHTVTGILNEVGIDSLRSLAANVLHYDITDIPGESATILRYLQNHLYSRL